MNNRGESILTQLEMSSSINYTVDDDIRSMEEALANMKREREEILSKYKIWQGKDGRWRCHLGSGRKERRLVAKTSKADLEAEILAYHSKNNTSVEDVWREVYKQRIQDVDIATANRENTEFVSSFDKDIRQTPIRTLSSEDWAEWLENMVRRIKPKRKRFYAIRSLIKMILQYAQRKHMTEARYVDVCSLCQVNVKKLQAPNSDPEKQILSERELEAFRKYLIDHPEEMYSNILLLDSVIALRLGELVTIKAEDFDDCSVHIRRTESFDQESKCYKIKSCPKTEQGYRRVFIPRDWQYLIPLIKEQANSDGWIAVGEDGNRAHGTSVRSRMYRVCEKAGIAKKSPHKLRKTGATAMRGRVSEEVIIEQMGHVNIGITRDHYFYGMRDSENDRLDELDKVPEFHRE